MAHYAKPTEPLRGRPVGGGGIYRAGGKGASAPINENFDLSLLPFILMKTKKMGNWSRCLQI